MLTCEEQLELDIYPGVPHNFEFRVVSSGSLWVPEYDMEYDVENYCLENFITDADDGNSSLILGGAVCFLQNDIPKTFDPNKIPIRKCCYHDEVRFHILIVFSKLFCKEKKIFLIPFCKKKLINKFFNSQVIN